MGLPPIQVEVVDSMKFYCQPLVGICECRTTGMRRPVVTQAVTFTPQKPPSSTRVTRRTLEKPRVFHLLNSLPFSPRRALCGFRYGQRGLRW
jgi:hypothetical protein